MKRKPIETAGIPSFHSPYKGGIVSGRLGFALQGNSRQFDADAQCKDEQPLPYFRRQGHQQAANYHQGYRHATPGAPVFQHAGVSRIPDAPLLIAKEVLGKRIGAKLLDQRFDLR